MQKSNPNYVDPQPMQRNSIEGNFRRSISNKKAVRESPQKRHSSDFGPNNFGEEDDSLYTPKRLKQKNSKPLLMTEIMGSQRFHMDQALAITSETNSLLKNIISQNNTIISLLKNLNEKF